MTTIEALLADLEADAQVRQVNDVTIVVEDRYQGRGLGTLLLERLVAYARTHGIRVFRATVYHDNAPMKRIIRRSGLPIESRVESGVWEIRMKLKELRQNLIASQ